MTLSELVQRVKVVSTATAEEQIKNFVLEAVVGSDVHKQWLVNRYRAALRRKVRGL